MLDEKEKTLQILPQTDSPRTADTQGTGQVDDGSGSLGNGQTPRSSSTGKEDTPSMAVLQGVAREAFEILTEIFFVLYLF